MRRKNLIKLSIATILIVSLIGIGGASAYHEYVYTFEDGHNAYGCHNGNANNGESSIGNLTITLTPSGTLETLEEFTISIVINNFTELDSSAYQNYTTVGISKDLGDNAEFLRSVNDRPFRRMVEVDEYGSRLTATTLDAIAPKTNGTFELVITAVAAMNQSDASSFNFTFAQGSINVTVVLPAVTGTPPPPGTIAGGILTIVISSTLIVATVLILRMRKRVRKREL